MRVRQLTNALKNLSQGIREVEALLEEMRAEHDPLAVHFFVARRAYRNTPGSKDGKKQEGNAIRSWKTACELGFPGDVHAWERLMGAEPRKR